MRRIAREEGYLYSDTPPYKILRTPWLSFAEISRIETIARLLDLFYNSGRFATTLTVLAETAPLSRLFAELAAFREGREGEGGSSLAPLFDELWEFAEGFAAGNDRERVRSALCYDYCLADYPVAGKLPGFFPGSGREAERGGKEKLASLARRLGIGRESRVRSFGLHFARDPRRPEEERDVFLLFVYVTTPGRGLEVKVLEDDAP
jgi:anaerobic magnesium-protoporphyrin IX monomethyl ester cyclase